MEHNKSTNKKSWLKREFNNGSLYMEPGEIDSQFETFIGNNLVFEQELVMLDQGLLEIKENNVALIEGIDISDNTDVDIRAVEGQPGKGGAFYVIKSLEKTLLQRTEVIKENYNFFFNFLEDLSKGLLINDFEEYRLNKRQTEHFKDTLLTPCRYLYKERIKIPCLWDKNQNKVYFVGFFTKDILQANLFLKAIMPSFREMSPMYDNQLFFSLEMNFDDAATLLEYSRFKLSKLLEDKTIYSREYQRDLKSHFVIGSTLDEVDTFNFSDLYQNNGEKNVTDEEETVPIKQELTKSVYIPLCEIYKHLKEANVANRGIKEQALIRYMEKTSRAILGKLEKSDMPSPSFGNPDFVGLNDGYNALKVEYENLKGDKDKLSVENEALKRKVEKLELDVAEYKNSNIRNTEKYIEITIPEIVNIVKEYETAELKEEDSEVKRIGKTAFLERLKSDTKRPKRGEKTAKLIFDALPAKYKVQRGGYRRSKN